MIRQAGIPWKESETALPRHQDTQLSLLSLMRDFQTELPANSCRLFTAVYRIPIEQHYYYYSSFVRPRVNGKELEKKKEKKKIVSIRSTNEKLNFPSRSIF